MQWSPPPQGIPIVYWPDNFNPTANWVHRDMSWPRKLGAWLSYIEGLRIPVFPTSVLAVPIALPPVPPYVAGTVPDIWNHRPVAADQLEAWFRTNQRVRWAVRRVLLAWRRHVMDRRLVGAEGDVGTMEPVPPSWRVTVYDWSSRSRYCFHVNTIHRNIVEALRFQTLAMTSPQQPKNPYTNLPWSRGQLAAITDQIVRLFWGAGNRFPDRALQVFAQTRFNMLEFRCIMGPELEVECARDFFSTETSEYWDDIYEETMEDLLLYSLRRNPTVQYCNLVVNRSLPRPLLSAWDELICGFWCFNNLNRIVLPRVCGLEDIISRLNDLIERTDKLYMERKNVKKRQRQT